jgi:hypothetical protein
LFSSGAISECIRLGADAAHGGETVIEQGIGGVRYQRYVGRKIEASKDIAYDFLDGTTRIQLKGPYLNPKTLEPVPNINVNGIANNINESNLSSGFDKLVIDTLGLTDEQCTKLLSLIPNKPTIVLR